MTPTLQRQSISTLVSVHRAFVIAAGHLDFCWHPPDSNLGRVLYCILQVITSSTLGKHTLARSHGTALKSLVSSPHPSSFSMCDLVSSSLSLCLSCVSSNEILVPSSVLVNCRPLGAMTPALMYVCVSGLPLSPFITC